MRRFLIFTVVCLTGMHSVWSKETMLRSLKKRIMTECARELNVDVKKYIDIGDYKDDVDEETTCVWACAFRKYVSEIFSITATESKTALYDGISRMIEQAYETNFEKINTGYTRADVVNKVEQCYANAKNECDFFDCIELHSLPLAAVNLHFAFYAAFHPGSYYEDHNVKIL